MQRLVVWLVALAMLTSSGTCEGQECRPCGPEGRVGPLARLIPQESHGADFRPACMAHDACYGTPGMLRSECDRQFRQDLLASCQFADNPALCRITARTMARGVRWGGGGAFRRAQSRVGR